MRKHRQRDVIQDVGTDLNSSNSWITNKKRPITGHQVTQIQNHRRMDAEAVFSRASRGLVACMDGIELHFDQMTIPCIEHEDGLV
uniref:Transposase n=1 Tax=Panagrellus redivivus TaxID=6233 RepID=A0A7E4W5Z2_PANRE